MISTTKLSTRGQIVIPQDIRLKINAPEGTIFAIEASSDSIILKKINLPSKEMLFDELENIAKEGKQRLSSQNMSEESINNLVQRRRLEENSTRH